MWHGFGDFRFQVEGIRAKAQGFGFRACGGQVAAHARSYRFKKRVTRMVQEIARGLPLGDFNSIIFWPRAVLC